MRNLVLVKVGATLVLAAAVGLTVRIGIADVYARRSTTEGLARAVQLEPGNADYHRWLGITLLEKDGNRAQRELREAVRLNSRDSDGRMRLALLHDSESELLETVKVDATFLPRWTLANFEFRHERTVEFWRWARAALPMSYGDRSPLFDLAAAAGETKIANRLGLESDEVWASYLAWAVGKASAAEIRDAAMHVGRGRHPESGALTLACDRLLDMGSEDAALEVWNSGVQAHVISEGAAVRGRVTNPNFNVDPGGSGFGWVATKPNGGFVSRESRQGGLRIHFTGDQSERCAVLVQRIAVSPELDYRVRVQYRTIDMGRNSGLRWAVSSARSQVAISQNSLWAEDGATADLSFRVPASVKWVWLEMLYQRPEGEVRGDGSIVLERVEMDRAASSVR